MNRALAAAALFAAVVVTACNHVEEPGTEIPIGCDCVPVSTFQVLPANLVIRVGDSIRFAAQRENNGVAPVHWRAVPSAILTIDNNTGLAHALAAGTAVVTAIAAWDTTVRSSAPVTVAAAPPPFSTVTGLTQANVGLPAVLTHVTDSVDVSVFVDPSGLRVAHLDLMVAGARDTLVESGPVPAASGVFTIRWHTDRKSSGTAVYPNGTYHLSTRLTMADSSTFQSAGSMSVTVANP